MKNLITFITLLMMTYVAYGQSKSLHDQRIWKLPDDKRSVFLDQGVFHHKKKAGHLGQFKIMKMRNSYRADRGYERLVFDFNTGDIPGLYGHISKDDKIVKIDFFNTTTTSEELNVINSKYVKGVDFYTFENDTSLEIKLKDNVVFDVFYLTNPGRVVVDIRK